MSRLPFERRPYRPGVGMALLNRHGEVFVGQRIDRQDDAWQMPQGGIDEGESPADAALRELAEEVGTDKARIVAETDWLAYDLPRDLADKVWNGRYRGQRQKWFALRFTGTDADIRLDAHHQEFTDWCWAPLERLPELIVPFKRPLYVRIVEAFRHLAAPEA